MTAPIEFPNVPMQVTANPMTAVYGTAPGEVCGDCRFLTYHQRGHRYYKCRLRKITNGAATDHRVRWPACGKFEAALPPGAAT